MKSIVSTLLFFYSIFTFTQINIDGHKGIYDSRTKTYLISVPKNYHISNLPPEVSTTFLPIVKIEGNIGYDYSSGTISVYMPDEEDKVAMKANIKWRGGTTNSSDKHKRNYKIKFEEDQLDKRKQRIILTKNCVQFCQNNNETGAQIMQKMFQGIPEKDIKTTIKTIIKMDENLK